MYGLLPPRVQQSPFHPFGGVNTVKEPCFARLVIHIRVFTKTPPHPAYAGVTSFNYFSASDFCTASAGGDKLCVYVFLPSHLAAYLIYRGLAARLYRGIVGAAFIYGSVAKGTDTASSDIDVMIVSDDLSFPDAIHALTKAESAIGRSINPSVYRQDEWRRKLAEAGGFLQRIMEQPRIYLIGSDDDLPKPGKPDKDR